MTAMAQMLPMEASVALAFRAMTAEGNMADFYVRFRHDLMVWRRIASVDQIPFRERNLLFRLALPVM